ncbi:hypothetical protein GGI03_004251 [Coemansia sp. RSA 2337]|nr:hypothetical protein H4S03_003585 [Coemansia sp. S3946]KAJ2054922.1 hypothetical protein GGI08_004348 [Coemansia sp. S2]KAJ2346682.1 hypothetical protein GGH92_003490 [Coemansia sp. RSA 2673]KAJ2462788.1 hypothetical protein GGI03_004251 [Coemansia sp. RSA 2337]
MDSSSGSTRKVKFTVYFNGADSKELSFKESNTVAEVKSIIAKAYSTRAEAIVFIPINDSLNREAGDDGGMRSESVVDAMLDDEQLAAFNSGSEIEGLYIDVGTVAFANSNPTITHNGSTRKVKFTVYLNDEEGIELSFKETNTVAEVKNIIAKAYHTTAEAIVFIPINDPYNREAGNDGGLRSTSVVNAMLDDEQLAAFNSGSEIEGLYIDVGTVAFANSNPTLTHRD